MKKVTIIALILIVIFGCIGLTACDSVSGIELTVYTNGVAETYKAGIGKTVTINPGTKNGYYLKGYYTEEVGGEKYFDVNGESLSVWNKSFPTVFYAQWESIEGFESDLVTWSDFSFSPTFGSLTSNPGTYKGMVLSGEDLNLIKGNLDCFLQFTIKGKVKSSVTIDFRLQDTSDSNAEVFHYQTVPGTPSSEYTNFTITAICSARIFKDNYEMWINLRGSFTFSDAHIKDLSAMFKVVE